MQCPCTDNTLQAESRQTDSTKAGNTNITAEYGQLTFFLVSLDRMDDFPVLISAPTNTKLLLHSTGSPWSPSLLSPSQDSPLESRRMTPPQNYEILNILAVMAQAQSGRLSRQSPSCRITAASFCGNFLILFICIMGGLEVGLTPLRLVTTTRARESEMLHYIPHTSHQSPPLAGSASVIQF